MVNSESRLMTIIKDSNLSSLHLNHKSVDEAFSSISRMYEDSDFEYTLLFAEMSAEFDATQYDYSIYFAVKNKLRSLYMHIANCKSGHSNLDIVFVTVCLLFIDHGYSLTKALIHDLNIIYQQYT